MKFLSLPLFVIFLCSKESLADETFKVRGLRATRKVQEARKKSKGNNNNNNAGGNFWFQENRQDEPPSFNVNVNPEPYVPPPPAPLEHVPYTDRRNITVAVQYYENPEDVGWILESIDREPYIPWMTSDVGDVKPSQAGTIVTQFKKELFIGRYRLTIMNSEGHGISYGQGWLKVFDVTNMPNVQFLDGEAVERAGAKLVLYQSGRTGGLYQREFDLE